MKSITASLVLPILAITLALVARPHFAMQGVHPAVGALAAGSAIGALSYAVMTSKADRAAFSKAVMIGTFAAQTVLVPRSKNMTDAMGFVVTVTLLFLYVQMIEQ